MSEHEHLPYAEFIDGYDIDQLMNNENHQDATKLARDSATIREIMSDMSELIDDSGEQLIVARECIEEADINVEDAVEELTQARKSQAKSIVLKGTIGGVIIGLLIGGPSGAAIGYAIGNAVLGGAVLGGLSFGGIGGSVGNKIYSDKAKKITKY